MIRQEELSLIEEMIRMRKALDRCEITTALWESDKPSGIIPVARESGAACIIENDMYVFGGFSREVFNDLRILDLNNHQWRVVDYESSEAKNSAPSPRYCHSMVSYANRFLVVFGGAGNFVKEMNVRPCKNDLFVFDSHSTYW